MVQTVMLIKIWSLAIVGLILAVTYSFVLTHTIRGNRNKWLLVNTALMLLSGVPFMMQSYGYTEMYVKNVKTPGIVWCISIGSGMSDGLQAIVHFLLAMKYRTIARDAPQVLDHKPIKPTTLGEKIFYWSMLVLNILSGPIKVYAAVTFRMIVNIKKEQPGPFVSWMFNASWNFVGFCSIISGIILVQSVVKIRRFFKERGDEGYINTKVLCQHATCFGSYLVACVFYYAAHSVYTMYPTSFYFYIFTWTSTAYLLGNVFSGLLLAQIFWSLGTDLSNEQDDPQGDEDGDKESLDFTDTFIEEFDEDAILQARIWNSLVRDANNNE